MKIEKINLNEELGHGSFGIIYPYQKNPDCKKYVVKVRRDLKFDKLKNALQEVIVGFNLDHPAILSYKDFHIEKSNGNPGVFQLYIKMPRMKMSLKQLIDNRSAFNQKPLDKPVVLKYIKTLLSGLEFLAQKKIAHRDIKPANILVDFDDNLIIADLGEAKHSLDGTTDSQLSFKGTVPYMAPELLSRTNRQKMKKQDLLQADLWSMGLTILQICLLGKVRTSSLSPAETRESDRFQDLVQVSEVYGEELGEIILSMLQWKPNDRKSIQDVYCDFKRKFSNYFIDLNQEIVFQKNKRADQEEEKMSNRTSKSLTPFNTYDPQIYLNNLPPLSSSLPDNYRHHYNSVINKEGEGKMKSNWQHLFNFNFDQNPTISLSRSQGFGGSIERSSRFQEMIQEFSKTVEEQKMKLSCFKINFSNFSDFTNQNFNQLVTEINKSLPDLKELSLNFAKCLRIDKEAVGSLEECFRKNQGLEKLSLNFDENPNIKDSFLADISLDIKKYLPNLKSLTLSFKNCEKIPHAEVKDLNKSLGSLTKLEDLDLNFEGCPGVGSSIKILLDMALKKSNKSVNFSWKT